MGVVQMVLGGTTSSSFHRWCVRPGSVSVCGCSSMTAPQKGAPEGRGLEERISSTRCVSSMLICHPLNLYCSSTGSISHIARTSASTSKRRRGRRGSGRTDLLELLGSRDVTLDPPVLELLVSTTHPSTLLFSICVCRDDYTRATSLFTICVSPPNSTPSLPPTPPPPPYI